MHPNCPGRPGAIWNPVPGAPTEFVPIMEPEGTVIFTWKSPANGSGGRIYSYVIERRIKDSVTGVFGAWQTIGASIEPRITIKNQPQGRGMEYRVLAINVAGRGALSNTARVVL